jgi:hypothetical protein
VDREEDFGLREKFVVASQPFQFNRSEACLPVIAMDYVDWLIKPPQERDCRS